MERINQFEQLLNEMHLEAVKKGYAVKKVVSKSTLTKSQTVQEAMLKAGLNPGELKPFTGKVTIREKGAREGDPILAKGKDAVLAKPKAGPGENAEPPEHVGLRVARAIGDMKRHALGADLNGPVTEKQFQACHLLARTGKMSMGDVEEVEKALNDGRALPTYILKKLGSGNA